MADDPRRDARTPVVVWEQDALLVWPDGSVASLVCRWCRGSLRARWAGTGWSVRHAQVWSCGPLEHEDVVHPRDLRSRPAPHVQDAQLLHDVGDAADVACPPPA